MKTFCKYEMTSTQWDTLKKKISTTDEEGNLSYVNCAVVELGKLCLEWGKDADDNPICIKENTKVSVDILWYVEPHKDFSAYEIFPEPCGVHIFAGCEQMYLEKYCQKFPEYCEPKPIEEI
jgi:hypothetical protein